MRLIPGTCEQYELIGGERRWRAASLAGLPGLRCRVITCDDATAVELRGVENYRRDQLNAIEEAIWFEQMLATGRFPNQGALAEYLGISQGQVSNRLRLLQLPEEWQARVISGELPPTHSREIVAWVDRPAILQQLNELHAAGRFEDISVSELSGMITNVVYSHSRSMDPDDRWNGPRFELTDERRQQLDCVTVSKRYGSGDELRAFNVELWDELQAEAKAAIQAENEAIASRAVERVGGDAIEGTDTGTASEDVSRLTEDTLRLYWLAELHARLSGHLSRTKGTSLARAGTSLRVSGSAQQKRRAVP